MKKFFTLIAVLAATVAANATDLYVCGTVNNWTVLDETYKMTETVADEEWTYDFGSAELVGQNFKINDGTWDFNLGSDDKLTEGTISLVSNGGNIAMGSNYNSITNCKITLKKDASGNYTLTATGTFTTGEKTIPTLYLRGGMNSWNAEAAYAFTREGDSNTWTYKADNLVVADYNNQGFKIADENWGDYNFGASAPNITLNEAYTLSNGSNDNLWLDEDTFTDGAYTFTMTKDGDDWTLTITSATAVATVKAATVAGKTVIKTSKGIIKGGHTYSFAGQLVK